MKKLIPLVLISALATALFAQSYDDDLFGDDGIEEVTSVSAKTDLSKGILFETGSVKIGGNLSAALKTSTVLYSPEDKSFSDNLSDTTITPTLGSYLTVDARPTQTLRIYTKFGFEYPFKSITSAGKVSDYFKVKEIFTDFSAADTAFFRFGIHTVTWGTGYFFSPVSDLINASSINPEDTDAQVQGVLNLRTQITFPNSQNCLWLYLIPDSELVNNNAQARDTAFAGKYEFVLGGWEFGLGGFYKYQVAPKAMLTATGSLKKMSFFSEFVYQYGSDADWKADSTWSNKTNIFKATAGVSYMWKDPSIMLAAQYYYDGNDEDITRYFTHGHNIAVLVNFGRVFGTTKVTASVFGMVNFGKEEIPAIYLPVIQAMRIDSFINCGTFTASLNYTPVENIKLSVSPRLAFSTWDDKPTVSLDIGATLGGGKF